MAAAVTDELSNIAQEDWDVLQPFETEYVPKVAPPVKWSVEKYKVAQTLALSGKNKRQTAKELKIPLNIIDSWLKSSEFQDYMQSLIDEYGKVMKTNSLMYLNKILQARIEEAEIDGYANLSRKDTLDIITEIRKETGDDKVAEGNYLGLLEKLVNHSLKNQQPVITVGGKDNG